MNLPRWPKEEEKERQRKHEGITPGQTHLPLTLADRLRANLDRALANHRCAGGQKITITTLAPLAGSTRWTLRGLGGHTRISTFQGIAGALGCTVAELVEDVEPTEPVDLGPGLRRPTQGAGRQDRGREGRELEPSVAA